MSVYFPGIGLVHGLLKYKHWKQHTEQQKTLLTNIDMRMRQNKMIIEV